MLIKVTTECGYNCPHCSVRLEIVAPIFGEHPFECPACKKKIVVVIKPDIYIKNVQ